MLPIDSQFGPYSETTVTVPVGESTHQITLHQACNQIISKALKKEERKADHDVLLYI